MTNEQIELLWSTFKKQNNSVNLLLTTFHGYNQTTDIGTVLALFDANGYPITTLNGIEFIAFDHIVFIPLGGGQISDTGILIKKDHKIPVFDLNKQIYKKVYIHLVDTNGTTIEINDVLIQKIDVEHRIKITKNHTIQHILNDGDMTQIQFKLKLIMLY